VSAPEAPGGGGRVLPIVRAGDPVLRQPTASVEASRFGTAELRELVRDMLATLRAAPGVGLAAPQVGLGLRLAIVEDPPELQAGVPVEVLARQERRPVPFQALVNPRLVVTDATPVAFFEGCLSVPGYRVLVPRARAVRVGAVDVDGRPLVVEASGWPARILQHELDHLEGVLCLDRMEPRSLVDDESFRRRWASRPVGEVREAFGIRPPSDPA